MITAFLKSSPCHSCPEGNISDQWLVSFAATLTKKITACLSFHWCKSTLNQHYTSVTRVPSTLLIYVCSSHWLFSYTLLFSSCSKIHFCRKSFCIYSYPEGCFYSLQGNLWLVFADCFSWHRVCFYHHVQDTVKKAFLGSYASHNYAPNWIKRGFNLVV